MAARRTSVEERRRVAADFDNEDSFEEDEDPEGDDPGQDEADGEDDLNDEDGHGETSPLLPIFEAALLGTSAPPLYMRIVSDQGP